MVDMNYVGLTRSKQHRSRDFELAMLDTIDLVATTEATNCRQGAHSYLVPCDPLSPIPCHYHEGGTATPFNSTQEVKKTDSRRIRANRFSVCSNGPGI